MNKVMGVALATVAVASIATAQSLVAPVSCVLENARSAELPAGPYFEPEANPAQPVGWWNSAGIISNETLIADGAPVPAVWPQHQYGFSSARAPRVRAANGDPSTPNGSVILTFDMGGVVDVDGIVLWNFAEGTTTQSERGTETAAVSYSTDGINFVDSGEILTFAMGPQDADATTLSPIDADPQFLATGLSGVTHVRLQVRNFSGTGVSVGFSEIRMIGDRPFQPQFLAEPTVKANGMFGEDYATESQTLAGSATNAAGGTITYEKTTGADWLVIAPNGDLSGTPDVSGTNEFTITAIDGVDTATGTLQIVVDNLGNLPVFTTNVIVKADATFNVDYASASQTLAGDATDLDGDTLIFSRSSGPGWLNVASNGALSGVCNNLGTNTFSVVVNDGNGNSDTASLIIFVPVIGSAPEFTADLIVKADGAFDEDYALKSQTLAADATDVDGDTLIFSKTFGPAWLNVASNGALSGVATVAGTNSFTVVVNDGNGNTDTTSLEIFVAPRAVGELIVGLDDFNNSSSPSATFTAADLTATITASAAVGNWSNGDGTGRGSSKDGTWGTHEGPPSASTTTAGSGLNYTLLNGTTDGEITFTIVNNGTEDLELGSFHFDALAFRPNAARTYALNVLAGSDITVGNVFTSAEDAITHLGGGLLTDDGDSATHDQHDDIDIFMDGIADNVLEAGGTAIIQIAFSDGSGSGGGHHLFIDNIGIALADTSAPVDAPEMTLTQSGSDVIVSWTSEAAFKLQTRASLTSGSWVDVPGGTTSPVTVSAVNDVEFLRLIEQ